MCIIVSSSIETSRIAQCASFYIYKEVECSSVSHGMPGSFYIYIAIHTKLVQHGATLMRVGLSSLCNNAIFRVFLNSAVYF